MQKWEYCVITGVNGWGRVRVSSPQVYFFGLNGFSQIIDLDKPPKEFEKMSDDAYLAHTIAKLGSEGWEMTGTGSEKFFQDIVRQTIYFKRPIE